MDDAQPAVAIANEAKIAKRDEISMMLPVRSRIVPPMSDTIVPDCTDLARRPASGKARVGIGISLSPLHTNACQRPAQFDISIKLDIFSRWPPP